MKKALIFGHSLDLTIALPFLLSRAKFEVDLISSNPVLKKSKFVKNLDFINYSNLIENLLKKDLEKYDFIIPTDDETLELILHSNLTIDKKLKLLPVSNIKGFEHIYSKIALSKILQEAEILTPEFLIAQNLDEAKKAAEILTYPVMLKIDSSQGGRGVIECKSAADFENISPNFFDKPILVQKKIIGTELDLSAIYRDNKLIFFSHSKIEKVIANKFGPSVLRLYTQLGALEKELFSEMEKLGSVINANGFVNVSCIETADKKRYFFECDMRPNSWVDFPKFLGNDGALKILNWFESGATLTYPQALNKNFSADLILPFFERMTFKEILLNRYRVWKYLPYQEKEILFRIIWEKFLVSEYNFLRKYDLKKINRKTIYKALKRLPLNTIRAIFPKKEDRIKIKNKIKQPFQKIANGALGFFH